MTVLTEIYNDDPVRYSIIAENGILFNTNDACRVLRILERRGDTVLGRSCLNMAGVIKVALTEGENGMIFVDWIESKFIGYEMYTEINAECDDYWEE